MQRVATFGERQLPPSIHEVGIAQSVQPPVEVFAIRWWAVNGEQDRALQARRARRASTGGVRGNLDEVAQSLYGMT